jgi:protein required for attachment to host cells
VAHLPPAFATEPTPAAGPWGATNDGVILSTDGAPYFQADHGHLLESKKGESGMSKDIPQDALIVVADGGKAILLRNIGTGGELALREERRLTLKDFVNDGPSGAGLEDQSPHETGEATFAKQLAKTLDLMFDQNAFKSVVLIADPQTLGQLRDAIHKNVGKAVAFTLSKDYTNHSVKQITEALS